MTDRPLWSPLTELRPGTTLIEASAGTGKTYNITSLVVRMVAELGIPVHRILVVTYTRAATAELSARIRARLLAARQAVMANDPVPAGQTEPDQVFALLCTDDLALRAERSMRLDIALESLDRAVISTIHGFCQRMLAQNAFEAGIEFGLELQPDVGDIRDDLVDDGLTRAFYDADPARLAFLRDRARFKREPLQKLARAVVGNPAAELVPRSPADTPSWNAGVDALRADWPQLVPPVREALEHQLAAAKAGEHSVFVKGQRTWTVKKLDVWVADVASWLDSDPSELSPPDFLGKWAPGNQADKLVDSDVPFRHPAIDRVLELAAHAAGRVAAERIAFADTLRRRFQHETTERRIQTYDDLLRSLSGALGEGADPVRREQLVQAIGSQFDAALIDEFQDTDAHQWTLFRTVFGTGAHHLYLIGDPKQAIYGFRGANVAVYTLAGRAAGRTYTMTTNWRSDQRLLDGLNQLLGVEGAFGLDVGFDYVPVTAPDPDGLGLTPDLAWTPVQRAPLQLTWLDEGLSLGRKTGGLSTPAHAAMLHARVARDVVDLLTSGATVGDDPVRPRDIAVLVRTGRQGAAILTALDRVGVPAVMSGAASVLHSAEARQMQHWMAAVAQPSSMSAARIAASSPWFGWSAERLRAVLVEDPHAVAEWESFLGDLREWSRVADRHGFMAAVLRADRDADITNRLLAHPDGERRVTNFRHVAELVHRASVEQRASFGSLVGWLATRRAANDLDADAVELRLDRDAEAVHILTIHKSKGLEFPICLVPWLWADTPRAGGDEVLVVADPVDPTRRMIDLGIPADPDRVARATLNERQESLRLAYVALTRAAHRLLVYVAPGAGYADTALAAILHGRGPDRLATAPERVGQGPDAMLEDLRALASASVDSDGEPRIALRQEGPADEIHWESPTSDVPELAVRPFRRAALDPGWRRHSYTSVTRAAGHPAVVEFGREGFDADAVDRALPGTERMTDGDEVPLAGFPRGAEAGTLLHEVLERVDFQDPSTISAALGDRVSLHGFDPETDGALLVSGLPLVFDTPLGGGLGDVRLADIPREHRMDELRFDLPMLGGSHYRGASGPHAAEERRGVARQLVEALRARRDGRIPSAWLASLDRLVEVEMVGFLTGSIDLVFRGPDERWYLADYKSNRLDPSGSGLCTADGFTDASMTAEMARHDYFLQAALYLVALHRFLRNRIDGYDYDVHVGGVYYLFVRGMVGPHTVRRGDTTRGCWFDRPPAEQVHALDAALQSASKVAG